ncbi:MAG: hypothetical protein JRI23_28760, partial [Deltaproteobacteria bacterium]|nr:hypothetical protein [Deltaproteobacteria bacterium]MBW2536105.1 hypothetical protein [Deltaproteobacteria bacterium]
DNKDNNYGVYHVSTDCGACSEATVSSQLADVTMFLMLDNSGSMDCCGDSWCNCLWPDAEDAVAAFVTNAAADPINFAFNTFSDGCVCDDTVCGAPDLGPTLLSDATFEGNVVTAIAAEAPDSSNYLSTAHGPSVQGMSAWGSARAQANPDEIVALVYVSDGTSTGACTYDGTAASRSAIAAPALAANQNDGVLFFTVALPSSDLALLDEIAAQGGTTEAIDLTGATNSTQVRTGLINALTTIQAQLVSCEVDMPNAAWVDPTSVLVEIFDPGGPDSTLSETDSGCTNTDGFYYLPDSNSPTSIVLCDGACTTLRNDPDLELQYSGDCAQLYDPVTYYFNYESDCSVYGNGYSPLWKFLSYDTTIVGDSTVDWAMSLSPVDAATALAGTHVSVSVADAATPDVLASAPVDLEAQLGNAAYYDYLSLAITTNPTSNRQDTPLVHDWEIQYTCEAIE